MEAMFSHFLNASFSGSIVIGVILLLRPLLKKAPKSMLCLLWLLAGVRLMLPVEIESDFSLQPRTQLVAEIRQDADSVKPAHVLQEDAPEATVQPAGIVPAAPPVNIQQQDASTNIQQQPAAGEIALQNEWLAVLPWLWLAGMAAMAAYTLVTWLRLKNQVRMAVKTADGCREAEGIATAFVLGLLHPQIYLPKDLNPVDRAFIVSHERTHVARCDHWWKFLGFLVLAVHWFNPVVWLAYSLLCRDMEMACDEQVVRDMDTDQRKAYSAALLACASGHKRFAACPVAFGEVSVKQRILRVLHYRKPGFWISLVAALAVIFVLVCFLTNPTAESETDDSGVSTETINLDDYATKETTLTADLKGVMKEDTLIAKCFDALTAFQNLESYSATIASEFNTYDTLNNRSFHQFWCNGENWLRISEIPEAKVYNQYLYKDGHLFNRIENAYYEEETAWGEVQDAHPDAFRPWIEGFAWNTETISLYDHTEAQGYEYITLTVAEELTMSGLTVPSFTLTFEFVEGSSLAAINLRLESEEETPSMNPTRESIYISMQLNTYSPEENAMIINEYYLSIPESITSALEKELLEEVSSVIEEYAYTSKLRFVDRLILMGKGYVTADTAITFSHTEESIQEAAKEQLVPYIEAGLIPDNFDYDLEKNQTPCLLG